jgi:hypothetical protein
MIIEITKKYPHTPFAVHIEQVKNEPGTWNSNKISIYRDGNLIGEYLRNYNNYGANTFYPFEINHEWYALYSPNYTATRVMKLHYDHIEDWCGEDPAAHGFCPVEFYVPKYIHGNSNLSDSGFDYYFVDNIDPEEFEIGLHEPGFISLNSCNFGFMAGCVWGDDSSWKLRYIDLSQIPDKILTVTDKFGYWELPGSLELKECINMDGWEPDHEWITLYKESHINLRTDENC